MFSVRSFGILLIAVFLASAFAAENSTVPVAAPSNTTVSNNSSSGEGTEIPQSESPVSEQKSENPTRRPTIDVSTTTPALVRDVSSSTPMSSSNPINQPKNETQAASSVSPKKEGKSGASVVNAGVVVVGVAILLTSVGFSWKL